MGQRGHISQWHESIQGLTALAGAPCNPEIGSQALAFRKKTTGGHDFPAWSSTRYKNHNWPLEPSKELKAKIRHECPRNYKEIIAKYGTLDKQDMRPQSGNDYYKLCRQQEDMHRK